MTRDLTRLEGLFVGGSGGAAVAGAIKYARATGREGHRRALQGEPAAAHPRLSRRRRAQVRLEDLQRRLDARERLPRGHPGPRHRARHPRARATRARSSPRDPSAKVRDVIAQMKATGISQLPGRRRRQAPRHRRRGRPAARPRHGRQDARLAHRRARRERLRDGHPEHEDRAPPGRARRREGRHRRGRRRGRRHRHQDRPHRLLGAVGTKAVHRASRLGGLLPTLGRSWKLRRMRFQGHVGVWAAIVLAVAGCGSSGGGSGASASGSGSEGDASVSASSDSGSCGTRTSMRGKTSRTVKVGTASRTYIAYLPPKFSPTKPLPFVYVFHGATMTGAQMYDITQYATLADSEGIAVVFPDGQARRRHVTGRSPVERLGQRRGGLRRGQPREQPERPSTSRSWTPSRPTSRRTSASTRRTSSRRASRWAATSRTTSAATAPTSGPSAPHSGGTIASLDACKTGHVPIIIFHGTADPLIAPGCDDPNSPAQSRLPAVGHALGAEERLQGHVHDDAGERDGRRRRPVLPLRRLPADGQVELCTFTGMNHGWAGGNNMGMGAAFAFPTYASATTLEWEFWKSHAW